ncbi:HlyD family efflux transporter periplasmic adaptor subunit [Billgrantia kenyensis]|uniref:HlyD family efflux transporter periplasmic adaptor subunit n=1 Tax=Billgrantia kenyensis TaxID=321266 RepID=A0A7V9VXS4_9GAMM|nr:HlyD family efflux transporter periplasmic adaptor subunit [Halomonas kenyensis]MBA2777286.1 HlyD family efflux transporter periplasmic adaptor subunit [Halomonas kenyensis]MCG6659956.1 HlyD family efflux transporter periplasmic adaptor subunit [Halomonas kenyensis]
MMQLADNAALAIETWREQVESVQVWLARHCEQAPSPDGASVTQGVVLWRQGEQWQPVALWPSQADGAVLLALADDVREARRGLVSQPDDASLAIGYPVRQLASGGAGSQDGALLGAVALRIAMPEAMRGKEAATQAALVPLMQRLEDGVAALERDALERAYRGEHLHQERLGQHLALLAAVLAEARYVGAAMQLVSRLASHFEAERVSLGWRRGTRTRVEQISHSAQFNRKMNRIRATETAMDEALDQRGSVAWPAPASPGLQHRVLRAQASLGDMTGLGAVVSVPLLDEAKPLGAVTLERDRPFSDQEVAALESLLALCGRALEEKRRNDRPLPLKALVACGEQLGRLLGPGYLGYKLTGLVLVGLVGFATFATGVDRIAADAILESREQRVMTAPFRGYIDNALVRPGDRVEAGQPLASMETRELLLEGLQWQSELAKFERQEQEMRARGDRAGLNVLAAQRDQAQARLALVDSRLERATLLAPFDGVVVSGDLTQRLGGAVEQGEELFRVSPLDDFRIELEVPEGRIDDVRVGQHGELLLAAMTGQRMPFVIERITPQSRSSDGSSRFVVEASLSDQGEALGGEARRELRPGLQGVGRIEGGEDRLIVIWTRELMDWLRLMRWRWWG